MRHSIFKIWRSAWYLHIFESSQFPIKFTTENDSSSPSTSKSEHPHDICKFWILHNFPFNLLRKMTARVLTLQNLKILIHLHRDLHILDSSTHLLRKMTARILTHWVFEITAWPISCLIHYRKSTLFDCSSWLRVFGRTPFSPSPCAVARFPGYWNRVRRN